MLSGRRSLIGALALGVCLVAAGCAQGFDPAPPHFLLGASKSADGAVSVSVVECYGGALEAFDVGRTGSDNVRSSLWRVEAEGSGGLAFEPGQEQKITVGSTPDGMREMRALAGPLPAGEKLSVDVNFTNQPSASYGFSFKVDDIEPGKTWIALGNGKNLSAAEFSAEATEVCADAAGSTRACELLSCSRLPVEPA